MTGWGCGSTPSGWDAANSFGRRRPMVWSPLPPRSSATCLRGLTGGTHNAPGDRRWPARILIRCRVADFSCLVTSEYDSSSLEMADPDAGHDELNALRAALAAEQRARHEAEARASGAEAMVAHLKLMIAKLRHDRFGASSERGRKLLDQMELELEELEAAAAENALSADDDPMVVRAFTRRRPVRAPLPEHLPRERVVIPSPTVCPCCGGALSKLGETIT